MKTKFFGGIAIVAIALAVAFNVSLNTGKTNNASLLALANVEALASNEGGTITKKRVKVSCTCKYSNGTLAGRSITECESYTWSIPMPDTSCALTNCPSGASCSN